MRCEKCGGDTGVIESRPSNGSVKRRRECLKCRERFTTYEVTAQFRTKALDEMTKYRMIQDIFRDVFKGDGKDG